MIRPSASVVVIFCLANRLEVVCVLFCVFFLQIRFFTSLRFCACSCILDCSVVSIVSVVCYCWIEKSFQDSRDIGYLSQATNFKLSRRRDATTGLPVTPSSRNAAPFLFQWQHMKSYFRSVNQ